MVASYVDLVIYGIDRCRSMVSAVIGQRRPVRTDKGQFVFGAVSPMKYRDRRTKLFILSATSLIKVPRSGRPLDDTSGR